MSARAAHPMIGAWLFRVLMMEKTGKKTGVIYLTMG